MTLRTGCPAAGRLRAPGGEHVGLLALVRDGRLRLAASLAIAAPRRRTSGYGQRCARASPRRRANAAGAGHDVKGCRGAAPGRGEHGLQVVDTARRALQLLQAHPLRGAPANGGARGIGGRRRVVVRRRWRCGLLWLLLARWWCRDVWSSGNGRGGGLCHLRWTQRKLPGLEWGGVRVRERERETRTCAWFVLFCVG